MNRGRLHRSLRCGVLAALLGPWAQPAFAANGDEAGRCLAESRVVERLLCLAGVAKTAGDPAVCHHATHPGVRWQCIAILAEHAKNPDLCRSIPYSDYEFRSLRDACVSDVAEARGEPALCARILTEGLRDSCYLKLVKGGADKALCARIVDPGLKSGCTRQPVYVK